jgi:hypothetical protein
MRGPIDSHPNRITAWKALFQEGAANVFGAGSEAEAVGPHHCASPLFRAVPRSNESLLRARARLRIEAGGTNGGEARSTFTHLGFVRKA